MEPCYGRKCEMSTYLQFLSRYLPCPQSYSSLGRSSAFLVSNSPPMKATTYEKWNGDGLSSWCFMINSGVHGEQRWFGTWSILDLGWSRAAKVLRREICKCTLWECVKNMLEPVICSEIIWTAPIPLKYLWPCAPLTKIVWITECVQIFLYYTRNDRGMYFYDFIRITVPFGMRDFLNLFPVLLCLSTLSTHYSKKIVATVLSVRYQSPWQLCCAQWITSWRWL